MTVEQALNIIRSKLKKDCIYYIAEGHAIRCCVLGGEPKCFTRIDQCTNCKDFKRKEIK